MNVADGKGNGDGNGNGELVGYGVNVGNGVMVAKGVFVAGVTNAVCVSKKDTIIVPTPAVTKALMSSPAGVALGPHAATNIATRKKVKTIFRFFFIQPILCQYHT